MRFIKSIAVSIATALLLVLTISVIVPFFSNNVNAAGEVIEVQNVTDLKKALGASTSKGKTVRIKNIMYPDSTITISTSLTLDLNYTELRFGQGKNLIINTEDENDVVTIIGQGRIQTNNDSYAINVEKGKLIFDTGCVQNTDPNGYCINSSSNIMILNGAFISAHEMGKDIVIPYAVVEGFNNYNTYGYEIYSSCLKIGGKDVTKDNCNDILGNGVFSYDLWTKTLHIKGNYDAGIGTQLISSKVEGLTISIDEQSSATGVITLNGDTTITGGNRLSLSNGSYGNTIEIMDAVLTVKDASLMIDSYISFVGIGESELIVDDAEIYDFSMSQFSRDLDSIELKNCKITYPTSAIIEDGCICAYGAPANTVTILPNESYNPATYIWSKDNSQCTATKIHRFEPFNWVTETVNTTSKVKYEPTTKTMGTTTYTATFTKDGFTTQTKDVQDIPVKQPDPSTPGSSTPGASTPGSSTPGPSTPAPSNTSTGGGFEDFVERLYTVALNRASEPEGKAFWCEHVGNGDLNGAQCANEFLLSKEFNDRKLSDEDFLKVLYKTFFDRDAADDPDGFNFWMNSLKTEGRDKVVDGFINSTEWCNICASYGVKSGATRAKAIIASKNATEFATRLYTECLGRDPEEGGLKFWSLGLTNLELTGKQAAHEFFFSKEFNDFNLDNEGLLTRMYKTFMGREPDDDGMNYWLKEMENGMTKEQVFNEFVKSKEFTEICQKYAIDRG